MLGLSGLLGMNFLLYRKSHLQHHKSPQKIGEDVDAPLYSPPLRVPPGLPRAWALLTGVVVSLVRKVIRKFTTRAQFGSKTIETERDWVQSGAGDDVVFTGAVPHERIAPYLNLIDIAVQPAANEYCCPMKILEYMAGGTPVVSTPLPLSQLVIGTDGVVLRDFDRSPQEVADAVIRLCDDADTRERFARVGFARVHDHYNWHHAQHDFIRALGL